MTKWRVQLSIGRSNGGEVILKPQFIDSCGPQIYFICVKWSAELSSLWGKFDDQIENGTYN